MYITAYVCFIAHLALVNFTWPSDLDSNVMVSGYQLGVQNYRGLHRNTFGHIISSVELYKLIWVCETSEELAWVKEKQLKNHLWGHWFL